MKPVPFDTAPDPPPQCKARLDEAVWCGPVAEHFGHAIADFGMRIAVSAHGLPGATLLFAHRPGTVVPAFFDDLLRQRGVDPASVVIAREAVRVATLHVFPRAERLNGPPPEVAHLDLMDRIGATRPDPDLAEARVYVSRSLVRPENLVGRLAGEAYLDEVVRAAGAVVVHPEDLPVAGQMRLYASAARLVFSEGSAVHGLQLLGRIRGEVSVLVRRPGGRMGANLLKGRTPRVGWVVPAPVLGRGLRRDGRGFDVSRVVTLPDGALLCAGLSEALGLDLAAHRDAARFQAACRADLSQWLRWRRAFAAKQGHGPEDAAEVAACLAQFDPTLVP